MVKWNPSWLNKTDHHGTYLKEWCRYNSDTTAVCTYDGSIINFNTQGFHALKQHSENKKHTQVHDAKRDETNTKLVAFDPEPEASPNSSSSSQVYFKPVKLSNTVSVADQVTNAEIYWLLKLASCDFSFMSCDDIVDLFKIMFENDDVTTDKNNNFSLGRHKASYVMAHGLGPYCLKQLVEEVKKCESAFTLMFDETTTAKKQKQMDILVRYWSEVTNKVETKYVTSFMFGRAKAEKLAKMLMGLQNDKDLSGIPWDKLCNISSDGPHINKKLWRLMHQELEKEGKHGLLPLLVCNIHMVHNAFRKGIDVYGEEAEKLCFDLHAWFKIAPCKEEDFRTLSDNIFIDDESLFLRHINARWLTLVPALERVLVRWEDAKKYFVAFLPFNKEYKRHLPKNERFQRINTALKKDEQLSLLEIEFLRNIAPIFTKFLRMFQADGPMIHLMHHELRTILSTIMGRFLKSQVLDVKSSKDLLKIEICKVENQLSLDKMDVGDPVRKLLSKCSPASKTDHLKKMQSALITITSYLQKHLPLDSTLLTALMCLNPLLRSKSPPEHICRIARLMPHVISPESISLLRDEWNMYRVDDDIQECWFVDDCGVYKRLDSYYMNVFNLKTPSGTPRYVQLPKVVKTSCSLQNGNAAVERSLSDNKNTVTKERTKLNDDTIKGLRIVKEFTRSAGGAHIVKITSNMREAVRNAAAEMKRKQEEERKEKEKKRKKVQEEEEAKKKMKEEMEKAEKKKGKLEKKEAMLAADEESVDQSINVTNKLLKEGQIRLAKAIASKDFTEIELANSMIQSANNKLEDVQKHREEQKKVKADIGKKRGSIMNFLIENKKKKIGK